MERANIDRPLNGKFGAKVMQDISFREAMKIATGWRAKSPHEIAAEFYQCDATDGLPNDVVSLRGNMYNLQEDKYGVKDGIILDPRGMPTIVQHMADSVFTANDRRLRFKEKVTEIRYCLEKNTRKQKPTECPGEGVFVKCRNGHQFLARFCILTVSHGVILSGQIRFVPKLPAWKLRAIKGTPTAAFTKIFVKFPDETPKFWDKTDYILSVDPIPVPSIKTLIREGSFVSSETEKVDPSSSERADSEHTEVSKRCPEKLLRIRARSPAVLQAAERQQKYATGYFSCWLNLSAEQMLPESILLVALLLGDVAKSVERKSDSELREEVTQVLRAMYPSQNVPEPAIYCTRWSTNPLALGSFHCISKGLTPKAALDLPRPVRDLHFAGDGADSEFTGYMNGAFKTGRLQATNILQKLKDLSIPNE